MTRFTHPPGRPAGVADYQCIRKDVRYYHSPGADHSIRPDLATTQYGCIGPDTGTFADNSCFELFLSFYKTAGVDHIRKNHRRAKEHILLNDHSIIYRYIILDL